LGTKMGKDQGKYNGDADQEKWVCCSSSMLDPTTLKHCSVSNLDALRCIQWEFMPCCLFVVWHGALIDAWW
jgi:hypothetical protein